MHHRSMHQYHGYIRAPTKRGRYWDILRIINPSTGMDQEIHPCGQGRIDSVKINPSLLRMRECPILKGTAWKEMLEYGQ